MNFEAVQQLVRAQSEGALITGSGHSLTLGQMLVRPERIRLILRLGPADRSPEEVIDVWLVGKEPSDDGYRIVMRDDGAEFGLASKGFPSDRHLLLVGWYGDLKSAFENM